MKTKRLILLASLTAAVLTAAACVFMQAAPRSGKAGGALTVENDGAHAFFAAAPTLPPERKSDYDFGQRLFRVNWLIAPASVKKFEGLGPVFNRISCQACHEQGGRGQPPRDEQTLMDTMLVRVSIPGTGPHGGPNPHPVYGDQLQDRAVPGVPPEGHASVKYEDIKGSYGDGASYVLHKPVYSFHGLNFGPLGEEILFSPRAANPVFGAGLLEAVPESTLSALAAEQAHGGEVSGRVNRVWDAEKQETVIGRFGWKANQPSLRQQIAAAFNGDIGITTPMFPNENCMPAQKACARAPHGHQPNLSGEFLDKITYFSQMLAVPAARDLDKPEVKSGEKLFMAIGCASCHAPKLKTGEHANKQLAYQDIEPFTDLLLHDMGENLADHRPDFEAGGSEWRTPPLWGIGLTKKVNGHTRFLHDGRARSLEEAILWHGGEAEAARERFRRLDAKQRAELISFLNSL